MMKLWETSNKKNSKIIVKYHQFPLVLTQEVISGEVVSVPDLQREARRDLVFSLIPGEHGLLLRDDNLLLSHEVIKREDKAPVEVALTSQGVVVHICVLLVLLLAFQPSVGGGVESRIRSTFGKQV